MTNGVGSNSGKEGLGEKGKGLIVKASCGQRSQLIGREGRKGQRQQFDHVKEVGVTRLKAEMQGGKQKRSR
jgi:hypothetical protein